MLPLHTMLSPTVVLLMLAAPPVSQSAAAAARADEAPSETVRYHDLDLNRPEDIASLYTRIQAAAADVCQSAQGPGHPDLASRIEWVWCVNHAIADAVKAVHNDKLSAYRWQQIRAARFKSSAAALRSWPPASARN